MRHVIQLAFAAALTLPAFAISIGQIDTFEDGTTMGWHVGAPQHPSPPANVATGGPNGVGDAFLRLEAIGGSGPGSKLAVFNTTQWTGDYTAAGVTRIGMSAINFGPDDLYLRLLLLNFSGGFPADMALTDAVVLAAGGGWQSVSFDIGASDLTLLAGSASGLLSNVQELRMFHNPNPTYPNPPVGPPAVSAALGVDNIQPIPEPATLFLMSAGMLLGVCVCRLRRQS